MVYAPFYVCHPSIQYVIAPLMSISFSVPIEDGKKNQDMVAHWKKFEVLFESIPQIFLVASRGEYIAEKL